MHQTAAHPRTDRPRRAAATRAGDQRAPTRGAGAGREEGGVITRTGANRLPNSCFLVSFHLDVKNATCQARWRYQ